MTYPNYPPSGHPASTTENQCDITHLYCIISTNTYEVSTWWNALPSQCVGHWYEFDPISAF